MDECMVEYCTKPVNMGGLCLFHRRREVSGQLDFADDGNIYDLCSRGHRWVPENTRYESAPNGGRRRRCKACLAERRTAKEPEVQAPQPIKLRTDEEVRSFNLFDMAANEIDAKCKGKPGPYADYTKATMPTEVQAALLCSGCPLFEACANSAEATKPGWGVWAGERWAYGERYYDGMRSSLHPED